MARRRQPRKQIFTKRRRLPRRKTIDDRVITPAELGFFKGGKQVTGEDIVGLIYSREEGLSLKEIMAGLDLPRGGRKELLNLLAELSALRVLSQDEDGLFIISRKENLVEAVITAHPKGFAFGKVIGQEASKTREDVFVSPRGLANAIHGDRVLLRVSGKPGGRMEGTVVRVLDRSASTLVGLFKAGRETSLVIPDDERLTFHVVVQKENSRGARNGDAVVVQILKFRPDQRNPSGRVVEVLGDPDDLKVQAEIVIRKHGIPRRFSSQAINQAESLDPTIMPSPGRADLREILHVTIDGETARDFDDAVAIEKTPKGYQLHVSIADVSHYVAPGSVLDKEAYERGTSVYFPNLVVPMLPERLSNNLCSLVPEEDRLAFTAILDFNASGKRTGMRFTKSIIRSRYRLTYTIVKEILLDRNAEQRKKFEPVAASLELMGELAAALEKRRMARGSIGFEIPEPEVIFGKDGNVSDIKRFERNMAHKLIEEFMLAANEAVAETLTFKAEGMRPLMRIHEEPDPAKVTEFSGFAGTMGLNLPKSDGSPGWFSKVLEGVAGTPKEYIISNLLLRTMKQARYSPENAGHFGLAAKYYTHFTSPIRRYPDLIVHRMLGKLLGAGSGAKGIDTGEAGEFLSKRERVAVDAEREMVDRLKVRFMAGREGETFEGIISGVTSFGLFIELTDIFVSGAVEIADMKDDYYAYHEKAHQLVGKRSGKKYQIGELVQVELVRVDVPKRRISFRIL